MIPKQQNEPSGSTWFMDYRCLRLRAAKQPSPPRDLLCLGMMPFVDFLATFFWTKWWILAPQSPPQRVSMFCNYWFGYGSIPINTILSGMNIHLPAILRFTRYQGFDPSPYGYHMGIIWWGTMWHRCESTNKKWGHPGCHRMFQAAWTWVQICFWTLVLCFEFDMWKR